MSVSTRLMASLFCAAWWVLTLPAAEDAYKHQLEFQQGARLYSGCALLEKRGKPIQNSRNVNIQGQTLRFADLQVPGANVKIHSAKLEMWFAEEGRGKVRDAQIQVFDAA